MKTKLLQLALLIFAALPFEAKGQDSKATVPDSLRLLSFYSVDEGAVQIAVVVKNVSNRPAKVLAFKPEWRLPLNVHWSSKSNEPIRLLFSIDAEKAKHISPELSNSKLRPPVEPYYPVELLPGEFTALHLRIVLIGDSKTIDPKQVRIQYEVSKDWAELYGIWSGLLSCSPVKVESLDAIYRPPQD